MNITPSQIVMYLNIFGLAVIAIGFIIGLLRGTFKATYRIVISLVIIVGLWFLCPTIFAWLINFDLGSLMKNFTSDTVNGYTVTTLSDLMEFASKVVLGLIEQTESGGWTEYTGDIVIVETQVYGLIYGLFEMVFRILFIVIVLILNWTVFRVIFGLIYYIIRPKKKEVKNGKRKRAKPKGLSRLGGGLVGALNAVFILFLIFVPLSGLFSIGEDFGTLMDRSVATEEDGKPIAYLAVGGEVIRLKESTLEDFKIEDLGQWAGVYRGSFIGQMFGALKIDGTEIDNKVFDDLFVIKTNSGDVKFREEINNVAGAVTVIADKVYEPLKENDFKFSWSLIDKLDGETITEAFDKLSDLKLIQVVVPVGVEFISNQSKNLEITTEENQMFDVVELVNEIKDANMKNVIYKLGEGFGSLLDAVHDSNMTIQEMMEAEDPVQNMLDLLVSINGEGVNNFFTCLADIEILDQLSKPLGAFLDSYVTEQLSSMLLMKPALTTDEDNYIYISGHRTNIIWDGHTNLGDMEVALSDDGKWILNGTLTDIDGSMNQYKLDFTNISISQEIRNLGNIFEAFQDLGITSISDFINYFSGEENAIDWDQTNFDYEHLERLFNTILASPYDYYFTYTKVESETSGFEYKWMLNRREVALGEYGINVTGAPDEGDRFIVHVKKVNQAGGIIVYETTATTESENLTNITVNKDTFMQKIEGYHNIGSTLLSCNTENVYCLVNNILPVGMRESLTKVAIDGGDVAALVMATKLLIDHGLIGGNEETDYSQLLADEDLVNELVDSIMRSKLLDKNLTTIINSIIVMATGDKIIEIHEEDWSSNKADDIKALFKVIGKVIKYQDKFSDIKSMTKEELDDLFGAIGDALTSGIISANIGNFVQYLNDQKIFGEFELIGMEKEYWTKAEAEHLKDGLMIFVDMLMATDSNIMSQLFQLAESDKLDSLLKSRFLVLNIINNLYNFAGEGGALSEFLCLDNITRDSDKWFDVLDNEDNVTKKGELRLILTNAAKLFKGIDDMGDNDVLIRSLIGNIGSLSNDLGGEDDDIGEILASIVLSDTLIKFMKSLPEKTSGILKIDNPDDIEWRDVNNHPGELRKLLKAISILLVEKEIDPITGEETTTVLYDKLLSEALNEKIGVFLDLEDSEINEVLDSAVITDTTKGIILDYSEGDNKFLYLRDRDKTEEEWSDCLAQFLISARVLLETTDEHGNKTYTLDKLQGNDTNAFLGMLLEMSDEDIEKLTDSEIIVDTLADKLIEYGEGDGAVLAVPGHLSSEGWTTNEWKEEEKKMIKSLTLILGDDSSQFDNLGSSADSLINMITKLVSDDPAEDKLSEVLESDVIVATMAKQILKYGEGSGAALDTSNVTTLDLDNDLSDWRDEEEKLIRSAKLLLADEDGNIAIDKLGQSTDKLFEMIVNLSDEDLDKVVASTIFTDTIAKNIRSFGEGANPVLEVSGTNSYDTDDWRDEIEYIIHSVKILIADEDPITHKYTVNVSTLSDSAKINEMFTKIVNLSNDVHNEANDELGKAIQSVVIADTFIKQIRNQSTLTIDESDPAFNWYDQHIWTVSAEEGELRKFIVAIDTLFGGGDIDIIGLDANSIMKKLRGLNNHLGEEDDEVGPLFNSMILADTMINRIKELDGTSLVVIYDEDDERWNDYDSGTKPGELRLVLQSLQVIFGEDTESDFSNISDSLKVDDLLDKSDEDIHRLLESSIVRFTAAKEVVTILRGDGLKNYIELSKNYDGATIAESDDMERYEMVADDLENLVKTLRDLRTYGVDYQEFRFDKFQTAYETNGNSVPDALQQSKLIVHSFSKMMSTILHDSVDNAEIRSAINTNITADEWKTKDSSGKEPHEVGFVEGNVIENGELRKVFKVMNSLESFNVESFDINDKKESLKDINHCKVTHNVIPTVIDKSLTTLDEWKYSESDRRELTTDEWDNEIDVFAEILTLAGSLNMNTLNVTADGLDMTNLSKIIKTMALSRYLNVSVLATKAKQGIEDQFNNGEGNVTVNVHDDVYNYTPKTETPESYAGKIAAWNGDDITIDLINASTALDPLNGEIDNVIDALTQLRNIGYTDILNILPIVLPLPLGPQNYYSNAIASATKLGNFLDRCRETRMLRDVPADIFVAINAALTQVYLDTIPYNNNDNVPGSGYCLDLLTDYVNTNNAAGKYK